MPNFYMRFADGGPLVLLTALLAVASGIWLLVRCFRFVISTAPYLDGFSLALASVHLIAICIGAGSPLPRIYEIAQHPVLPLTHPIENLPSVAGSIAAFLTIGAFTGVGCLLLTATSLLRRHNARSTNVA